MIPREESPKLELTTDNLKTNLEHSNTRVNLFSDEYESMNNVFHVYQELGKSAMSSAIIFNHQELIEILLRYEFPVYWRKYPDDTTVEKYMEYQASKLEYDLLNDADTEEE